MENFRYKGEAITFIIGLVLIGIGFYCHSKIGDYSVTKPHKCLIIKKIPAEHYHKNKVYNDFILVLKDEKGRPFDIEVSPTTYTIHDEGEYVIFNIEERDIDFDITKSRYDFIGLMGKAFGGLAIFISIIMAIYTTFFEDE